MDQLPGSGLSIPLVDLSSTFLDLELFSLLFLPEVHEQQHPDLVHLVCRL